MGGRGSKGPVKCDTADHESDDTAMDQSDDAADNWSDGTAIDQSKIQDLN
jgi:hypothetical protein